MADTQHFRMAVKTKQRIYLPLGLDRPPRRNDRHCGVPDLLWAVLRTDSRAAGLLLRHWSTAEDQLAVLYVDLNDDGHCNQLIDVNWLAQFSADPMVVSTVTPQTGGGPQMDCNNL